MEQWTLDAVEVLITSPPPPAVGLIPEFQPNSRYSQRLNVFVSWMMANSLCYDERINNTDITQLWRHSRSITEDIAQAETKLRELRKEKAQEVARVAEAREEVQKART